MITLKNVILAAIFVLSALITGVLLWLPIYPDEILWKATGSRLFLDDFSLIYLFPECRAGYYLPVPISWLPSRLLDAALYGDASNPMSLRYYGVATYLAIWSCIGWIAWKSLAAPKSSLPAFVLVAIAATSFGVLAPVLVLNRPEQGVLVPLLLIIAFYAWDLGNSKSRTNTETWGLAGFFIVSIWMMLAAHVKSIFLLPVALVATYYVLRKRIPIITVCIFTLFGLFETTRIWSARVNCPESPFVQNIFDKMTLSPALLWQDPGSFLVRSLKNLASIPRYILDVTLERNYQSNWLPPVAGLSPLDIAANAVLVLLAIGISAIIIAGIWNVLRQKNWLFSAKTALQSCQ